MLRKIEKSVNENEKEIKNKISKIIKNDIALVYYSLRDNKTYVKKLGSRKLSKDDIILNYFKENSNIKYIINYRMLSDELKRI